ncbi:MAG: SRPBCC domain-containing protein [Chitinophagaceae bacterium]|nr:SRPBCC domain-containing protein [Chitinophagaceae bacterium]
MATVTLTQTFKAPIEKVWSAITAPEKMKHWYFHVRDFNLKTGNVFTFYEKPEGGSYLHRCEILKVVPQKIFEHTWEHPSHSKGKSVLKWELESMDENHTRLTLTHSGLENFADAGPEFAVANFEFGWKAIVPVSLRNYLYGIEKLVFAIDIKAPREKVWQILWEKNSYTQWTSVFTEGSYYEGALQQGGRIHFLWPGGSGLYSDIVFLKENSLMLFSHIGIIKDKQEQAINADTEVWTGNIESYRLTDIEGGTNLTVELDCQPAYKDYMNEKFPQALQKVKQMCEG